MALMTGKESDLEFAKKLNLNARIPSFFDATKADKQATNPRRIEIDWRYFQILALSLQCNENLEALNQIDRIEHLYSKKADRKVIRQAVKKLNDMIGTKTGNLMEETSDKFATFRSKLEHELVPWDSASMKSELNENMWSCQLNVNPVLRRLFVEPMNEMMGSGSFEELGDEILTAPALERAVWFEARPIKPKGSNNPENVKKVIRQLMMEHCNKEEKEKEKGTPKKKPFCSAFSLGKKKAHRDVLDMYDMYDYDEVSAYHVDVQPPQSQALQPFYFPNANLYQMRPQPVVIADHGYDAGDSLVFATLFGVGLLSLVLCLLVVIVFGAATAFGVGVYVSSKQSSKPCHDDDRNSESSVV